jgi:hypothetical protein
MTAPLHERVGAKAALIADMGGSEIGDLLREAAAALRPPEGGYPQAGLRPMFHLTNPPTLIGYDVVVDGRTIAVLTVEMVRSAPSEPPTTPEAQE